MKTWTEKTIEKIRANAWTESEMRSARRIMQGALNERTQQVKVTARDAVRVLEAIEESQPFVSDDQRDKGAAHLRALAFRKDGTQRQTRDALQLRAADLDAIRTCKAFRLVRFEELEHGRWVTLLPVYRCIGEHGAFAYMAPSWQSGYRFEVIR